MAMKSSSRRSRPSDDSSTNEDHPSLRLQQEQQRRIATKEAQVLAELSEALNTLTTIQHVLTDVAATLTEPDVADEDDIGVHDEVMDNDNYTFAAATTTASGNVRKRNIAVKLNQLLSELFNWEELYKDGKTRR
jgi:hypothetical protein